MILLNVPAIHCDACAWQTKWIWCDVNKTEANLASTRVLAARCVRVIHAQCVLQFALLSRTLLRSSSNNEPSDPPYRIIFFCFSVYRFDSYSMTNNSDLLNVEKLKWQVTHAVTCYLHSGATQSSHTNVFVMMTTVRSEEVVLVDDCVCAIKNER